MDDDTVAGRLGDVLVAAGLLTPHQVEEAATRQRALGCRLGEALVRDGVLTQDQVNWALARHLRLPYVEVSPNALDAGLARRLRHGLLYQHSVIPLLQVGDVVTLAMADPTDSEAVREVAATLGCSVQRAIARADAIHRTLDTVMGPRERPTPSNPPAPATPAGPPRPRRRLGEILLDALLITEEQLADALAAQATCGKRLGEVLIERNVCTEDQVCWALAHSLGVPYIDIQAETADPGLAELLPVEFMREHCILPAVRIEQELVLAMADPLDEEAIARAGAAARANVIVAIARRGAILAVLAEIDAQRAIRQAAPDSAAFPGAPAIERPALHATRPLLTPGAAEAFRQMLQQAPVPVTERIRVYHAVVEIASASGAEPDGGRALRRRLLAGFPTEAVKLALRLLSFLGRAEPPILTDSELAIQWNGGCSLVADRQLYETAIQHYSRLHALHDEQVRNAVMAARAWVRSGGKQKILLISQGERELAVALTKVIRRVAAPPAAGPQAAAATPSSEAGAEPAAPQTTAAAGQCAAQAPQTPWS